MRLVFGVVALLAVLAAVGLLVKSQLKATGLGVAPAAATAPAMSAASGPAVLDTQRRMAHDIGTALEQGAARRDGAAAGEGER